MHTPMETEFVEKFTALQRKVHETATAKGWWKARRSIADAAFSVGGPSAMSSAIAAVDAQAIALMHSELSEALEASRHGQADDKIGDFNGVEAELADCIIRIMDFAEGRGLRVAAAIIVKARYNEGRPYLHGKKY